MNTINAESLAAVARSLCEILDVPAPQKAAPSCTAMTEYAARVFDGDCGSHGLDMPEDLNIVHLYKAYKAEK